jgi:hypothetical protein
LNWRSNDGQAGPARCLDSDHWDTGTTSRALRLPWPGGPGSRRQRRGGGSDRTWPGCLIGPGLAATHCHSAASLRLSGPVGRLGVRGSLAPGDRRQQEPGPPAPPRRRLPVRGRLLRDWQGRPGRAESAAVAGPHRDWQWAFTVTGCGTVRPAGRAAGTVAGRAHGQSRCRAAAPPSQPE